MAAVLGLSEAALRAELRQSGFTEVDVANLNSPTQIVVAGPQADIERLAAHLSRAEDAHVVPLRVSAAFHSRYMSSVAHEFRRFLSGFRFNKLRIPVLANVSAAPYEDAAIADTLAAQIASPVRWTDTVRRLLSLDSAEVIEVGHGRTLSALIRQVRAQSQVPADSGAAPRFQPQASTEQ